MDDEQKLDLWEDFAEWVNEYPTDCHEIEVIGNVLECCLKFLIADSCCAQTALMRAAHVRKLLAIALAQTAEKKEEC
jgi:hypothetical protein